MNFDKIFNQVKIETTMTVERTLLVGSGAGDISPTGIDMPQIRLTQLDNNTPLEVPYIPGSSLKGAIRSTCETLIRTYLRDDDNQIICYKDTPSEKECCGSNEKSLCMMCDTFGDTNRMSKVAFDDAFLKSTDNLLETIQHRTGIKISRKFGTVEEKAMYRVEFIPKGTQFKFNILCSNILASELKLLLLAMRLYNDGRFKIGGQKSRGMGAISFAVDKITMYLPKLYRQDPFEEVRNNGTQSTSENAMEVCYKWSCKAIAGLDNTIVFDVLPDEWEAVLKALDNIKELVKRLYPVAEADPGHGLPTICVRLHKEGTEEQMIEVGTFWLDLAGLVTGVRESGNKLEYIIERPSLSRLFEAVYDKAFDFLGGVEREALEDEPHRALGQAGKVTIPLGNIGTLTVREGERLHTVLVWLQVAKMLVEA